MKRIIAIIIALIMLFSLSGCKCEHQWKNATCIAPVTCSVCAEKAGEPIGHQWIEASCTKGKTCIICNATEGSSIAHSWVEASCSSPKKCSVCGLVEGSPSEHTWHDATKKYSKYCSTCGKSEQADSNSTGQSSKGNSGTSETPKTCLLCSYYVSRSNTLYCSRHDCGISSCSGQAKSNGAGATGSYCTYHSCHEGNCLGIPIGGTNYCASHS